MSNYKSSQLDFIHWIECWQFLHIIRLFYFILCYFNLHLYFERIQVCQILLTQLTYIYLTTFIMVILKQFNKYSSKTKDSRNSFVSSLKQRYLPKYLKTSIDKKRLERVLSLSSLYCFQEALHNMWLLSIPEGEKAILKCSPWSTVAGYWLRNATEHHWEEMGVLMHALLLRL